MMTMMEEDDDDDLKSLTGADAMVTQSPLGTRGLAGSPSRVTIRAVTCNMVSSIIGMNHS